MFKRIYVRIFGLGLHKTQMDREVFPVPKGWASQWDGIGRALGGDILVLMLSSPAAIS